MAEAKAFKMIPHCTKDTIQYEMDELVRCKECKHLERLPWLDGKDGKAMVCRKHAFTGMRTEDWFCADGEKRYEE